MKIVRTIVWVLLLVALLIFSINNWNSVEVRIWEGLLLETKIPALVILSFLIGLVPMWLLHLGTKWRLKRRIASLEAAARHAAETLSYPSPEPEEQQLPRRDEEAPSAISPANGDETLTR